jgi:preprotein translocase subunit SecE
MNVKVETRAVTSPADMVKYALAGLLTVGAVVGFYWFSEWPAGIRGAALVALLIAAGAVFAFTARGRSTTEYLSETRFELRKVVWPTRQETMRATMVIGVVVVVISLLLALIDFLLSSAIRALLG